MNQQATNPIAKLAGIALLAASLASLPAAEIIHPKIGEPLRDAAVARAPDGTYYLLGTRVMRKDLGMAEPKLSIGPDGQPDFLDNDGIKLWSSIDLVNWNDEGLVWEMESERTNRKQPMQGMYGRWRTQHFFPSDRPYGSSPVRGVTTPRLLFFEGKAFLTDSMCGQDVGVLRSKSGAPSGPYEIAFKQDPEISKTNTTALAEKFSRGPGGGSLVADTSGGLFLVWGPGYLRQLNPDGTDAKKPVEFLLSRVTGFPSAEWVAKQFDQRVASVFRHDGKFYLTWAAYTDGAGFRRDDSFYAVADNLLGPYSEPQPLIAGSGPVVLFQAGEKGLMASYSVGDAPVLVPVTIQVGRMAVAPGAPTAPPGKLAAKPGAMTMFDYAAANATGRWFEKNEATGLHKLVPMLDIPLADTSITKGGDDDAYYMVGTVASRKDGEPDFQNNDGIHVWRSTDLADWTYLGKVWDIEKDGGEWQKQFRIPGDNPARLDFCRGVTAPDIRFADGTFWIAYSMNGRGVGLLKSTPGKAEGPYEDLGRLAANGGSPSFFSEDGAAWLTWGQLLLARLDESRRKLAGPPQALLWAMGPLRPGGWAYGGMGEADLIDPQGGFLFHYDNPATKERRIGLTFSAITQSYGRANRETFIASAPSLQGPWAAPLLMVRHGGQNNVFTGPDGTLYATFFGGDFSAVFRDRPGLVRLEPRGGRDFNGEPVKSPQNSQDFFTARGPWDEITQTIPRPGWRDPRFNRIGDTWYAGFSAPGGPVPSRSLNAGVVIWQSKDLKNWTPLHRPGASREGLQDWDAPAVFSYREMKEDEGWPTAETPTVFNVGFGKDYQVWHPMIHKFGEDYFITCWMGGVEGKNFGGYILKSQTGKPEGPYKRISGRFSSDLNFPLQADDGNLYLHFGIGAMGELLPDLSGYKHADASGRPDWGKLVCGPIADGSAHTDDIGGHMFQHSGRWFQYLVDARGDYGGKLLWSERFDGPWHIFAYLPYTGNITIAGPGERGDWYLIPQPMGPYAAPRRDGPVVLPLHFEPNASPPVMRFPWDMDVVGKSVY